MKQEEMSPTDLAKMTVLYTIPGVEAVTIRRDEPYRQTESGPLTMDVYYPPGATAGAWLPAVAIVYGYSDAGFPNVFGQDVQGNGCNRLVGEAHRGVRPGRHPLLESGPCGGRQSVLHYVREHAASLGIDDSRLGFWAGSANVPLALWFLMQRERDFVKCAALCSGFMLDSHGATGVADIQKTFRFANPTAGKSVDDVRTMCRC